MKHTDTFHICNLELDGQTLRVEDVLAVARADSPVSCSISCEAQQRMGASNALKHDLLATRQPIYGVTTGFGDSAKRQIAPEKAASLQQNLVQYHLNGIGPVASPEVARATLLIRANCLARGNSGARVEVAERLLSYLHWDLLPLIPERGSVGASGDLVPLSYVASALIGQGEIWYEGKIRDVREVLSTLEIE
ncbi:MAG: aromatic amino acid lyase, partial [Ktedonobacteraceae bacterium]